MISKTKLNIRYDDMADPSNDAELHERTQSKASKNVEAQTQDKKRDSDEEVESQESIRKKLRSLIRSDRIDMCVKLFFVVLSIPWLISTIFFAIFDTKCIVFEQASVINCSQGFFIANPRHWVFAWLLMSIISSFLLILIVFLNCNRINYQTEKAKKIWRKGYAGSLIFLLLTSLVYYVIRIYSTRSETTGVSISILVFLWPPVIVLVICCLNYLPRPHWTKTSLPRYTLEWWKDCLTKNSNFFIYWLALVVFFVEITCKAGAIMLDVAHDVAPLIQNKFPDESGQFRGVMVIVIGFRLAFHLRVLSFFWQKLFHGEKDLFSEPHTNLVEEPFVQKQCNEHIKTAHLDEIICT